VRFTRDRRGLRADPDELEAGLLRRLAEDLLVLLGDEPADPPEDPLEALLGTRGDTALPEDPALARLLPDAYADDDPDASREFRRYTEGDLRAGKRADAGTVLATLAAADGGRLTLDRDQAAAWLGCLNDLRLVLGTRLEVTEDLDPDDLDQDDPRSQALAVYGWLGWLQESLLSVLLPRG
jgi:hypothetical protein